MLQGGILDNVTGELPSSFAPFAQAGESSGQPAYAARVAWTRSVFGMPLTLGAAGYYSRQNWSFDHNVDGWAAMTDWSVPLARRVSLTGEFYRGRAIGGLGGGVGRSVLFSGESQSAGAGAAPEFGGRMVAAENYGQQQTGVQRRVRSGQSVRAGCAGLSLERRFPRSPAAEPQLTGECHLSSTLGPALVGRIPSPEDV